MRLSSFITAPLSLLWGAIVRFRGFCFDSGWLVERRFPIPIIGVGNLAVGGTGKTPHVEYLLRLLHGQGYRVAMLSRGYGRKTKGYILADRRVHTAVEIGDEPYQMMRNCPFATIAVCEKRVVGVQHLMQLKPVPDVIILDDAYQHRYVKPGLNILLTEASRPYTCDHLMPWGRLREPAVAARRADVVILTKSTGEPPELPLLPGQRLYVSRIDYAPPVSYNGVVLSPETLAGKRILLVAAIANPTHLRDYLRSFGSVVTVLEYRDHHTFTPSDAANINNIWMRHHTDLAVTTQKDAGRLSAIFKMLNQDIQHNLVIQPITVRVEGVGTQVETFNQTILDYVRTNQRNR